MNGGWIKLHSCLFEKAIWKCSTPEQKVILITILASANWKENQWHWKGKKYICRPGQFITSSTKLAERAGVSRQNVRSALVKFKNYDFLTYESTKTGMLITVVNWATYQVDSGKGSQPPSQELTKSQPRANQEVTTIEDYKNIRSKDINTHALFNEELVLVEDEEKPFKRNAQERLFDIFWNAYPKKRSKGQAETTWKKLSPPPDEQLVAAMVAKIEQAKTSENWTKEGGRFIPYPSTWLNAKGWEDEYEGRDSGVSRYQREDYTG